MPSEAVKRLRIVVSDTGTQITTDRLRGLARAQRDVGGAVREFGGAIDAAQSRLTAMAARGGLLGSAIGLGAGFAAFTVAKAGLTAVVSSVGESIEAFQKYRDQQVAIQNAIQMTGGAAGKTAGDLLKLADAVGDIGNSRQAVQALLQFRAVSGETFDRALKAANDLSATGFGGITESARAIGKALTSPAEGLAALEAAGLRFGARQKAMVVDMMETGRQAEAQRQILDALGAQIDGAGAARADTLTGAYTALSDAMQRGREQFGATIVQTTHLVSIVQSFAAALDAINDFRLSPTALFALRAISGAPVIGPVAIAARTILPTETKDAAQTNTSQTDAATQAALRQRDAIDAVMIALEKEAATLRMSAVDKKIDTELRKAGVAADSEAGKSIADRIRQNAALEDSIKARNEAEKKAIADAERAAELSARRELQARHSLQTGELEISLIGRGIAAQTELRANLQARQQLEEDAARTRTAFDQKAYEEIQRINAALAKQAELRAAAQMRSDVNFESATLFMSSSEQRIAQQMRGVFGDDWKSHMNDAIADQMRFNDVLRQTHQLASDFASSFISDLRQGVQLGDALGNAMNRLADRLIQMATDQAINMLFKNLSGIVGGGGSPMNILPPWMTGSANGNAGNVIPFARGGIVDHPTIFPMARGMGLMGEAGPEAVMPLRRAPDGRLGVAAANSNQASTTNISFSIDARGAQKGAGEEIVRTMSEWVRTPHFKSAVAEATRDARARRRV